MHSTATFVHHQVVTPPRDLAGYVKFFWTLESEANDGSHYIFRTMANGCPVIFFYYDGQVREAGVNRALGQTMRSGIYGATETTKRFRLTNTFGAVGLCLYPFAVPLLFNMPPAELSNQVVTLSDLLGDEGRKLEEQVMLCNDNVARIQVIADFIRAKILRASGNAHSINDAVVNVMRSQGQVNIPALADQYCLSRRTFERRFREHSGFSPKTYANVVRFQSAFDALTTHNTSLTEIAYQCGYYDQSHFTNEFTRLSGFNPKNFTTNNPAADPLWLDFVAFFPIFIVVPAGPLFR